MGVLVKYLAQYIVQGVYLFFIELDGIFQHIDTLYNGIGDIFDALFPLYIYGVHYAELFEGLNYLHVEIKCQVELLLVVDKARNEFFVHPEKFMDTVYWIVVLVNEDQVVVTKGEYVYYVFKFAKKVLVAV